MAGQEVAFARAIAAENASLPHDPKTGLTREDIEHDLEEAAARKKRIDDERAAKAGAEVAHVSLRVTAITHCGRLSTSGFAINQVKEVVERK